MPTEALDARQREILEALCRTVLPSSDTPGADELGVIDVLLIKLEYMPHLAGLYQHGIEGAERTAQLMTGKSYTSLNEDEAKQVLLAIQKGEAPPEAWPAVSALAFFNTLRMDVLFVYSCDPEIHERIGFPGPSIEQGGYSNIDEFPQSPA